MSHEDLLGIPGGRSLNTAQSDSDSIQLANFTEDLAYTNRDFRAYLVIESACGVQPFFPAQRCS